MSVVPSPEVRADALVQMAGHLTAPLEAGAAHTDLVLSSAGTAAIPASRRPLLAIVLERNIGTDDIAVSASISGQPSLVVVRFAPFSPQGATLVLWSGGEQHPAADCTISATRNGSAIPAGDIADWFSLDLFEGNLGRVLAVLGDEKTRLRREIARLAAMRSLKFAAGDALDRIGADLGVPRLESAPRWDGARDEIIAVAEREDDASYRWRLKVWRPFIAPTPAAVRALLAEVDPRVVVRESGLPMAASVRIVGASADASDPVRERLLEQLRADRLVYLNDLGPGASVHAARPMTAEGMTEQFAMRTRLAGAFAAGGDFAVAPRLAQALDRAACVLSALGAPPIPIVRAQDDTGGSRYETGMGVAITLPGQAQGNALRTALLDAAAAAPGADPLADRLIRQAAAANPPANDRTLGWLWEVAGLATMHRIDADTLYLSHLGSRGLTIETTHSGQQVTLRAVFNAPGDPGRSAALAQAVDRIAPQAGLGLTLLDKAATSAALGVVVDLPPASPASNVFAGAGLPAASSGVAAAQALGNIPDDLWVLYEVESSLATSVLAGDPAAGAGLRAVVEALRAAAITSLLPLPAANRLFLAAGVVSLPSAGVNLGERIATGVRWLMVPLAGSPTLAQATGFMTSLAMPAGSLAAVVALGYVRDEAPDPYELQIDLPDGELLDLAGYERLMNALERIFALGVQVNTWRLRQHHVDLDGLGGANPLPPRLARHYRQFRMPRMRGLEEPGVDSGELPSLQQ
ncbi:MAG: hypothetical protein WCY11_15665, partial [Novosphingobium sp.]